MKNNQKGFTLIEMMIVLLINSVLLIITVPNISKHSSNINTKGCEGYMRMVEAQVQAYKMDKKTTPSFAELKSEGYLKSSDEKCPDGTAIEITTQGQVQPVATVTP
jgi:competence protein ComGC